MRQERISANDKTHANKIMKKMLKTGETGTLHFEGRKFERSNYIATIRKSK